ncbi:hypothetical protein VTN00DRAFT_6509 [Thermoascus crustaceus]|uniref:uncharacterized protein n=1 Tax=Thermoascus crustaceus TaxID=5088 RepID=UPI003742BBFD
MRHRWKRKRRTGEALKPALVELGVLYITAALSPKGPSSSNDSRASSSVSLPSSLRPRTILRPLHPPVLHPSSLCRVSFIARVLAGVGAPRSQPVSVAKRYGDDPQAGRQAFLYSNQREPTSLPNCLALELLRPA